MKLKKQMKLMIAMLFLFVIALQKQDILKASEAYTIGQVEEYDGQSTIVLKSDTDMKNFCNQVIYKREFEQVTKVIMEEGVTNVYSRFMDYFINVEEVTIPSTLKSLYLSNKIKKLDSFQIAQQNNIFKVVDGILYHRYRNTYQIACYPYTKTDSEYMLPVGASLVSSFMVPNEHVTSITIGDNTVTDSNLYLDLKKNFPNLEAIHITSANLQYRSKDGVVFNKEGTKLIAYPPKGGKSYEVPKGTVSIENRAFKDTNIESVIISKDTKTICRYAFEDTALKSVIMPDNSVTYIGIWAFRGTPLTKVRLPEGLVRINSRAFSDTKIAQITLPKSVTAFESNAFENKTLKKVTISSANKKYCMYQGAVYNKAKTALIWWPNYNKVSKLTFPSTLKSLRYTMVDNSGATAIVIPKSLSSITYPEENELKTIAIASGNKAFVVKSNVLYKKDMSKIVIYPNKSTTKNVTFAEGLKSLDLDVFGNVTNHIVTLTLPKSLSKITSSYGYGSLTAGGFEKMTTIKLKSGNRYFKVQNGILYNKSMTKLYWFPINKNIKSYTMPSTVTQVRNTSLAKQNYLESITIAANCTDLDQEFIEACDEYNTFYIGLYCPRLKAVNFKTTKGGYRSAGGVVYTKYWTKLVFYPLGRTNAEYSIAEGCEQIDTQMKNPYLRTLNFPSTLTLDTEGGAEHTTRGLSALEKITVSVENPLLKVEDGVVYTNKEACMMLIYPTARKSTTLTLPVDFKGPWINDCAKQSKYLKNIKVAEGNPYCYAKDNVLYQMDGTELFRI